MWISDLLIRMEYFIMLVQRTMDKAVSIYESEGRIYYDVFMMFEKFPTDKYPSA